MPRHALYRAALSVLACLPLSIQASLTVSIAHAATADNPTDTVIPVKGSAYQARLMRVDPDWTLHLSKNRLAPRDEPAGRPKPARQKPAIQKPTSDELHLVDGQWIRWGRFLEASRGTRLVLNDGSLLRADIVQVDATSVHVESTLWSPLQLPLASLAGILLDPPRDTRQRDRMLQSILKHSEATDQLWLDNGDRLDGALAASPPGTLGLEKLNFRLPTQTKPLAIDVDKIVAVALRGKRMVPLEKSTLVGFRDGSRLGLVSLTSVPEVGAFDTASRRVRLMANLAVGGQLATASRPPEKAWTLVCGLQRWGRHVTYVSDLPHLDYRSVPLLSLQWPFQADRNVRGGQLRAAGQIYRKGIGMHSRSRLAYELDGRYSRFAAELAIDDSVGKAGSVVFQVYVQSKDASGKPGAWQQAAASEVVRGGQAPLPVSIDVTNVHRMVLIVEHADRADIADHANWLDARLIP